jgi:hypothetical protein
MDERERVGGALSERTYRNMAYWRKHATSYPFPVETDLEDAPRPEAVQRAIGGDFLRVPLPEIGVVFWGFNRDEDRKTFMSMWGGTTGEGVRGQ